MNEPTFGEVMWKAVVAVVVAVALWLVLASALWGFSVATAGIYGRGEAEKRIQSAGNRIAAYDHFFNLCASVQSDEASLDAQYDRLEATTDPEKRERIETNIAALKANRLKGIFQYNADATKDYTIGQFRDSGLPYQLVPSDYDQKGAVKTTCK